MDNSRKRALKERQERERKHKQSHAKWGKQRKWAAAFYLSLDLDPEGTGRADPSVTIG
jgi:hypothetical protein